MVRVDLFLFVFGAFLYHIEGQNWRDAIARRNGGSTTPSPAPTPSPRSGKILGKVWVPPSEVVVYENGENIKEFTSYEAESRVIKVSKDVKDLAIKVRLNKSWWKTQTKMICRTRDYHKESMESSGDDGSAEDNTFVFNPMLDYTRNRSKMADYSKKNTTKKAVMDEEEEQAQNFFDDPLEYTHDDKNCQPVAFNLFLEGHKDWYSGKDWFCCDRKYPGWQDWCARASSPQPPDTIWHPAYVVNPSWNKVINTNDNFARNELLKKAKSIWVWSSEIDPGSRFTPSLTRRQDVGQELRRMVVPRTAYCCLRIRPTPAPTTRSEGRRVEVFFRDDNRQGSPGQGSQNQSSQGQGSPGKGIIRELQNNTNSRQVEGRQIN